ncbi:MAG: antitoxin VbhA family protein [Oscillospiraceae bacterium]|nr:antitoxin VbhA family protein [Oscillospiraceae bacterium]
MELKKEQAIRNAVASAIMEGLHPTEKDVARIRDLMEKKITRDEFVAQILAEVKEAS